MNRAARRRGESPEGQRRLLIALSGLALAALLAVGVVFALVRGGDEDPVVTAGDGTPGARTPSTGGTRGGPQPTLTGPANRFAAAQEETGGGLQAVPNESSNVTTETYPDKSVGPFKDITEGREKVRDWGYIEGYVGVMQPDGLLAGVVQGGFYVRMEVHLFATVSGAIDAYEWYNALYEGIDALDDAPATSLANESRGWKSIQGKVENTELDRAYHRFIFRRGNLVGIVQTVGADTFMTIDPAREIAVIMDDRALGNRAAPTPTPSGGELPATPTPGR